MPLHLLGKKSWNVYNADNIARVRRDEAAAAAAEHAAEQRMQEVDAARRLAILRGETPPPIPEPETEDPASIDPSDSGKKFAPRQQQQQKKRKRAGEDDTDFEMRVARERAEAGQRVREELAVGHPRGDQKEADIVGRDGHINLVGPPPPPVATGTEKNPEYEREAAKKARDLEDQYTMRFSNAAGRDGFAAGEPWYAKPDARTKTAAAATRADLDAEVGMEAPTKNVWGNEDPRRKVREAQRLTSSDPLAMMRMGARKVREVAEERKREAEEREKELRELKREEHTSLNVQSTHGDNMMMTDEESTAAGIEMTVKVVETDTRAEKGNDIMNVIGNVVGTDPMRRIGILKVGLETAWRTRLPEDYTRLD